MAQLECTTTEMTVSTSEQKRASILGVVQPGLAGLMTFLGTVAHTLPFLIPAFVTASFFAAAVIVAELLIIAWIRNRFMETPLPAATFQVVVGGVIVFLAGILIGNS